MAGQTGVRPILTEETGLVDFGQKNWFAAEKTGFGRFWRKKLVLVNFDPPKQNWSIFAAKVWFWSILAEKWFLAE